MKQIEGQMSIFEFIPEPKPVNEWALPCDTCGHDVKGCCDYDYPLGDYCVLGDKWIPKEEPAACNFSGHSCNKENLWEVADTLDDLMCPHVCCRKCNTKNCGARCNGSEEPKHIPPIERYLRHGPHTLIPEVREETKAYLDKYGVPEWVKWSKSSLPCENCTWWDGTNCYSGGHTNHFEYGYLICDGFYQSCVERKPSTVGDSFPRGIKQEPHIYPLEIKGICDDAYCPQCGYIFITWGQDNEIDYERCPECHVKVDWTLWHRMNDEEAADGSDD